MIYPLDEWEILREQIEYEGELGRGAFGVVYKAILRERIGIEVFNTEVSKRTLLSSKKEPKVVAVKVLHGKISNGNRTKWGPIRSSHTSGKTKSERESYLFHHGDYRSTWTTRSCYQPIITTTKFVIFYCAFHKHANSLVHKPPS